MKHNFLKMSALAISIVVMTGCAQFQKSVICTQEEHDAIVADNNDLLERKKVIEGYLAGGPIPWEFNSALTRKELESAYAAAYNRAVDNLVLRSEKFNRLCVNKGQSSNSTP